MKNILNKVEFHYTFIVMIFGLVITGHFVNTIIFTSLIIVHEMGHVITFRLLKYDIDKIIIYPYGGLTKLNTKINTRIEYDLFGAISGIIMQCIYFGIIFFLYKNGIGIREYTYNLFLLYHRSILIFNLLPIYPLDGAKIINLILSKYFRFNISNYITVFISLIVIILFLLSNSYERNYSTVLVVGILLYNIYKFYNDISYIYNRFMLERYLYNFNYRKRKIINNKDDMYKNRYHLFNINDNLINEKEYIKRFFEKRP